MQQVALEIVFMFTCRSSGSILNSVTNEDFVLCAQTDCDIVRWLDFEVIDDDDEEVKRRIFYSWFFNLWGRLVMGFVLCEFAYVFLHRSLRVDRIIVTQGLLRSWWLSVWTLNLETDIQGRRPRGETDLTCTMLWGWEMVECSHAGTKIGRTRVLYLLTPRGWLCLPFARWHW